MVTAMALIVQLALNTLQAGSVYVLFALGLTLIFGVMGVVNFAHGQFFTLGCPAATAYGDRGVGVIPPNSDLTFEVELVGIVK